MLTYQAASPGPPEIAWRLLSEPTRWHEWAPHIRGARGLGRPEVEAGRAGTVRVLGLAAIPARITAKEAHRSWTWKIGPVSIRHRVAPRRAPHEGCTVAVDLEAPAPLELMLRITYGPVVQVLVSNLARVASRCDPAGPPVRAT